MKYLSVALAVGLLAVLYLWHESAEMSAVLRNQRDALRQEIEQLGIERDALQTRMAIRSDTLEVLRQQADSLESITDALRRGIRNAERDIDTRPRFDFAGSSDTLVARTERVLRARLRAAVPAPDSLPDSTARE